MDVADCCAHACLTVAGGKAAACNGVFQHHTPCVGQICGRRAGQRDLRSERYASPSLPCPAPALHTLAEPLHARTVDHPLPRPWQVVIWAVSTPTWTSRYPLAQLFALFCMVSRVFAANVVVNFPGARSVAQCVVAVPGGGLSGGCFWTFMHIFLLWHHCLEFGSCLTRKY